MLDESLPAFFYKRSPDGLQHNTAVFFSQHGSEPEPAYTLQRADPTATFAKNCYAAAMFDSYNPEVLYGEVMIKPEWTQPSLNAEEIRRNNGVPPPPCPILPTEFTIQLYNPDQQITVIQRPGTWGGSASYEFSMPQTTFRTPSASCLDRTQDDPAASATTPKLNFVWRKESKLAKDLTCYMTGKSTDTVVKKKHRDPDITVALYRSFREVTIYEPNLYRVEMEDPKGLEVVLLLGAAIIKDLYFSNNINQTFNVSEPARQASRPSPHMGPVGPGAIIPLQSNGLATKRKSLPKLQTTPTASHPPAVPPPADPRQQWEIDAETARLRAQVEAEERTRKAQEAARRREREKADEAETRRLRKLFEAEQREAQRKQAEVDRETERLRREYGVPSPPQQQQLSPPPIVPPRDGRHSAPSLMPIAENYQHHQQPQSQFLRPGDHAPRKLSNGLYMQPSGSRAHASSAAVMSGGNPHVGSSSSAAAGSSSSAAEAKRMKKKSFFGLRSLSDDSTSQQKLVKKASAIW